MKKIPIAILLIISTLLVFSPSAYANVFGGPIHSATTGGVESYITLNSKPAIYSGGMSTAWVALHGSGSLANFAQIGWAVDYGVNSNNPYTFFGYENTNGSYIEYNLGNISIGTTNKYTVCLNTSSGTNKAEGYINGTVKKSVVIDWTPNQNHFKGERLENASQFPGKTSNHETFSGVKWYNPNVGWQTFSVANAIWSQSPTYYNVGLDNSNFDSNQTFDIWDMGF